MTPEILAPVGSREALEAAVSRAVDDPAEFCADLCVPLGYRTFDLLSDGARTVVTASRFVGELEVCNASLIFTFSGSTLTTVTGTFLPPIDTSESAFSTTATPPARCVPGSPGSPQATWCRARPPHLSSSFPCCAWTPTFTVIMSTSFPARSPAFRHKNAFVLQDKSKRKGIAFSGFSGIL